MLQVIFIVKSPPHKVGQGGDWWGVVIEYHPQGWGVGNHDSDKSPPPHLAPPMPVWGVVGHNIDRCITHAHSH